MKPHTRMYINAPLPDYTYVLRWWLTEPGEDVGTQSQVMVLRSDHPLLPRELKERVEAMGAKPARFVLVDLPRNSVATLDTWEPFIEFCGGPDTMDGDIQLIANWWAR